MASKSTTPPATVTAQPLPPTGAGSSRASTTALATSLQPGQLSGSQFASLLSAIQESERRLDNKLADFKADVRQALDKAATKAVSKMRHDKPYEYKKKSHEEQARFNAQVEETVQEAQEALTALEETPSLQRARDALEKGARLLTERQKLIKIADRSANGWGVVTEYTADELADDSDDEKRLEKAEKAAERKAVLRKRKRPQPTAAKHPPLPPRLQPQYGVGYHSPQQLGPSTSVGIRSPPPPLLQRAMGPCFACAEMGHLRSQCPKMQSLERKWYPSHMLMHEFVPHVSALDVAKCCSGNCPTVLCDSVSEGEVSVCEQSDVLLDPGNVVTMRDVVDIDPENIWVRGETVSDTCVVVKGRLKESISFWKHEIKAPASIINIIESGYVLPLKSEPTPFTNPNTSQLTGMPHSFRKAYLSSVLQDALLKCLCRRFAAHCLW